MTTDRQNTGSGPKMSKAEFQYAMAAIDHFEAVVEENFGGLTPTTDSVRAVLRALSYAQAAIVPLLYYLSESTKTPPLPDDYFDSHDNGAMDLFNPWDQA